MRIPRLPPRIRTLRRYTILTSHAYAIHQITTHIPHPWNSITTLAVATSAALYTYTIATEHTYNKIRKHTENNTT